MKKTWRNVIAGIIATATLYPATAYADQGVLLTDHELKDEKGSVVHTYKKGERVQMAVETEEGYAISLDHNRYFIDKKAILKTHNEQETSITVKEEFTPLRLITSLFSKPTQILSKGEVVQRVPGVTNDEYWIQVKTDKGLIGFVYRDSVEINYLSTQNITKAFVIKEHSTEGKNFEYGQEISLIDYLNGSFIVREGEKEYTIPESHIAFTKPSEPLILTPPNTYPEQLKIYGKPEYIPPVNMKHPPVSSRYGMRWGRLHAGTDIAIPTGTPLYAVADGIVKVSISNQTHSKVSWGNYVKIDHVGNEETLYGHMHRVIVKPGQPVKQGQLLGYSGNSGHSTGSHLHFELYKNGNRVDSYYIVHQPELYR